MKKLFLSLFLKTFTIIPTLSTFNFMSQIKSQKINSDQIV